MRRLFVFAMFAAAVVPAHAALLWDQYGKTANGDNVVDQEFGDFPSFSTYVVGDVSVTGTGWLVNSISGLFTDTGTGGVANWNVGVTTGRLNIFAKTGALPGAGDDPSLGAVVGINCHPFAGDMEITAAGLGIPLLPGDYWIGLTPIADFGTFGQAFHYHATPQIGDVSAVRNPGGGFGAGAAWGNFSIFGQPNNDSTLRVEGERLVPEPATMAALGMGALALIRRRRRA